jgi:small subunit ribosomal protein S20
MANKKAALKSIRQTKKRYIRNKAVMSELRTLAKKARTLIDSKNRKEADTVLKNLESKLYRAARHNTIKKNNASRHISRLRAQWAKI